MHGAQARACCVLRVLVFASLAVCVCSRPILGQTSANGSIRAYVRDATGALLPETPVTAVGPAAPFTAISDKEGYYRLLELPPGEYELTAEREGFTRFVRPGIAVRAV